MHTLILYKSQKGATKQYSEWLAEELGDTEAVNVEEGQDIAQSVDLSKFERIVIGTPTYGGQIIAKDFLIEIWPQIKSKKVYLMVVGMIPQNEKWSEKSYHTIPQEIRDSLAGYAKLPGQVEKKISRIEGITMRLFLGADPEKIKQQDHVHKEDLAPILEMMA